MGDEFVLESTDPMTKLSFSHAIAQSTKLSLFEDNIRWTLSLSISIYFDS